MTGFVSHYSDLRTFTANFAGATPSILNGVPFLRLPYEIINGQTATSRGAEVAIDWRPQNWWRLQGNFSHLKISTDPLNDPQGIGGNYPHNTASIKSSMDIGATRLDLRAYQVGSMILTTPSAIVPLPSYTTAEARVSWNLNPHTELAITGKNLVNSRHIEYISDNLVTPTRLTDRTFLGSLRYSF